MSNSSTHHEPITPTPDTGTAIPKPDVATAKPYSEIAAALPNPDAVLPDAAHATHGPEIQHNYTIPGDHIPATDIPYNDRGMEWRAWRSKFTTIAALYVLAARHRAQAGDSRRAVHAVFSPPQADVNSDKAIRHWRAKATEVAQEAGIRSGMAAFHGYRVNQDAVAEFKSHIFDTKYADTATDVLLWEWLRRSDWRNFVQWGPHIHIIGLSEYMDDYTGDGVLHRLRTFEEYDREINMDAVAEHRAVAKDTVDHLTFRKDDPYPPFAWFGELEGEQWWSAEQKTTDATLEKIRDRLINGPSNPEYNSL